jgi:hypothetical protein
MTNPASGGSAAFAASLAAMVQKQAEHVLSAISSQTDAPSLVALFEPAFVTAAATLVQDSVSLLDKCCFHHRRKGKA